MSGPGCMCNSDLLWLRHVCCTPSVAHLLLVALAAARCRSSWHQPAATNGNRLNSTCTNPHKQHTSCCLAGSPSDMRQVGAQPGMTHTSPRQPYCKHGCCHSTTHRYSSMPCAPAVPNTAPRRHPHRLRDERLAGAAAGRHQPAASLIDATSHTDHPAIHSTWRESKRD